MAILSVIIGAVVFVISLLATAIGIAFLGWPVWYLLFSFIAGGASVAASFAFMVWFSKK